MNELRRCFKSSDSPHISVSLIIFTTREKIILRVHLQLLPVLPPNECSYPRQRSLKNPCTYSYEDSSLKKIRVNLWSDFRMSENHIHILSSKLIFSGLKLTAVHCFHHIPYHLAIEPTFHLGNYSFPISCRPS